MYDAILVERARNGDFTAVEELLTRHQSVAYTAALRLLGSPADAEDIAQDALVRAYTKLDGLAPGGNFAAWLRRIAINLSLNALRRRGLIRFEPFGVTPGDRDGEAPPRDFVDETTTTPEQDVVSAELRDEIDELVRTLPPDQRVAVVLRDMYGYDVAEVAELQRCGLSAAKMRIVRGRAHLRKIIEARRADGRMPA